MKNCYSEKVEIKDVDIDFNQKVSVPVLMRLMQQVIFTHANNMGLDHNNMIKTSNAFWIVSKIKLVLLDDLVQYDKVNIKTWTETPGVLRFNRNTTVKSANKMLVKGISEWCCLDWSTRKPRKSSSVYYPELEMAETKKLNISFSNTKKEVTENDFVYSRIIYSTDIDLNFHTNNLRYNYFTFDAFSVDELKNMDILEYEIHFVAECKEGDKIDIYKIKDNNYYYIEGKLEDKTIFRSIIKCKEWTNTN